MMGGDDLEDGFLIDPDSFADASSDVDYTALEDEDTFLVPDPSAESPWSGIHLQPTASDSDATAAKKKRRREKEKEKKQKKRKLEDTPAILPNELALQSPTHISDVLAQAQKRSFKDLTQMELDDMRIPASSIIDTRAFEGPRTADALPSFIRETLPNLAARISQKPKHRGAPTLLILAGAALRVTTLTRAVRPMKGDKGGDIAKLFARHFKLSEHIAYLHKTKIGVGIGTPDRIGKLLAASGLQTSALTHIMLDTTHLDSKKRSLLDIPETRADLCVSVLGGADGGLLELVKSGTVKVVLF